MSHKELWNTIVHCREIWPMGHPLYDLDIMVLGAFLFWCMLLWVVLLEWKFCRWEKQEDYNFEIWERQWKLQQEREEKQKRSRKRYHV